MRWSGAGALFFLLFGFGRGQNYECYLYIEEIFLRSYSFSSSEVWEGTGQGESAFSGREARQGPKENKQKKSKAE